MVVGIDLNDVIRDFTGKLGLVVEKYLEREVPDKLETYNLVDEYGFTGGTEELNSFLYIEASLEIFGHASEKERNITQKIINLNDHLYDTGDTLLIISKELNMSKPATYFFLSKTIAKVNNIKFVRTEEEYWDHVDILITANPIILDNKPEDKISIKQIYSYNKDCESDYTINGFDEVVEDDYALLYKASKTKTIGFTEIE